MSRSGRHALVLGAGAARRFGGGKLVALWHGLPIIEWSVRAALASEVERVTLVTGADRDKVLQAIAHIGDARLKHIHAHHWANGMSASIKAGIEALPEDAKAVAIFLGDMPAAVPEHANTLFKGLEAGAPAARLRHSDGPAHPVAFAREAFPALTQLKGDQGARRVLEALGGRVLDVPVVEPGAVMDIDTPGDLARAQI
jgi:molybdenum cofactor cytidylyltransferase